MIAVELMTTMRGNGEQSKNVICIETGISIDIDVLEDFVTEIGGYVDRSSDNLSNYKLKIYNVMLPDMDAFNTYISFCKLMD